jgi:hypothetical protein
MNIALTRNEWLSKALALILALVCYIGNFYLNNGTLIFECCLVICAVLLLRSIKHKYIFLMLAAISTYVLLLYPYFWNNLKIGAFDQLNQPGYYQKGIYVFSVFLSALLFFFKDVPYVPLVDRLKVFDNNLIFYFNVIIMIVNLIFGARGQSVLSAGYGQNETSVSIFFVYFPIFFLAAYSSSGRDKSRLLLINVIAIVFIIRSLLFGSRGNSVSMLLLMYFLYFDKHLSFKAVIALMLLGFTMLSIWAQVRVGLSLAKIDLGQVFTTTTTLRDKYEAVGNNQTDVFYASVRIISLRDMGFLNFGTGITAFLFFVCSLLIPSNMLPPIANLAIYMLGSYNALGGGMIFAYFYGFFSYFGVILIAWYISFVFTRVRTSTNLYMLCYGILAMCTVITWFAYGPVTLFKLCILGTAYIAVMNTLSPKLVNA